MGRRGSAMADLPCLCCSGWPGRGAFGYHWAMREELEILASGMFSAEQIVLTYTDHHAPPPEALSRIEERWEQYMHAACHEGRTLFNSPVAYLKSVSAAGGILNLELGPTDYKTFLVTTLRDQDWFQRHSPAAITPALGNSILLTHAHTAYLGVRSKAVAAYPHWAHLFGGVLDWPAQRDGNADVLLEHLYRELDEELGIGTSYLAAPPRVLAVMRDPLLAQPELVWHGELKEPLPMHHNAVNPGEHDGILAIAMTDNIAAGPPMTPVSKQAIVRAMRRGGNS